MAEENAILIQHIRNPQESGDRWFKPLYIEKNGDIHLYGYLDTEGAVNTINIAEGAITGPNGEDPTALDYKQGKIADSTIRNINIANETIEGSKIASDTIYGDTYQYDEDGNLKIDKDGIPLIDKKGNLANNAISTRTIQDEAVNGDKIASTSIRTRHLFEPIVVFEKITLTENQKAKIKDVREWDIIPEEYNDNQLHFNYVPNV